MKAALALVALVLVSTLGLVPTSPAEASSHTPVLVIPGAGGSADDPEVQNLLDLLNWAGYDAHAMTLPADSDLCDIELCIPGTAHMDIQAQAVGAKVVDILGSTSADKVEVIGLSVGALAARHYIKSYGGVDEVSGLISVSGINMGQAINLAGWTDTLGLLWCKALNIGNCNEVLYGFYPNDPPGETTFLKALNGVDPTGDPTPGNLDYYHVWTEDPNAPVDGLLPSGHDFTVWSAQQVCQGSDAQHGDISHPTMLTMIGAALERSPMPTSSPECPPG